MIEIVVVIIVRAHNYGGSGMFTRLGMRLQMMDSAIMIVEGLCWVGMFMPMGCTIIRRECPFSL